MKYKRNQCEDGPFLRQILLYTNDNFTVKQSCEAELVISLMFLLTKISYYNYDLIQIKLLFDSDSSLYFLKSSKLCIMAQKN